MFTYWVCSMSKDGKVPIPEALSYYFFICYIFLSRNGGWASESFMKDNLERLRTRTVTRDEEYRLIGRDVYVLYYGDYDPTGLRMVQNLKKNLEGENERIHFEHIAITKEQIAQYGLEHLTNPDTAVLAKLERDSNAAAFKKDNNGQIFQIELDALNALMPEDFITLLEDSVDRHFDEEIYDEIMADPKHSAASIMGLVRRSIKKFPDFEKAYNKQRQTQTKRSA